MKVNNKNSVFVVDFYQSVDLLLLRLCCFGKNCSLLFLSQPTKAGFTQEWRERKNSNGNKEKMITKDLN